MYNTYIYILYILYILHILYILYIYYIYIYIYVSACVCVCVCVCVCGRSINIYEHNHQVKSKRLISQVSELLLVRRLNGIQKPPVGKFHLALLPNHAHMLRIYLSKVSCSIWYV